MAYLLVGRRAKEIAAAAAKYNLEYLERDPSGITRRPLSLFAQSDGRVAENLLVGRMRGREVYGFDFPYLTGANDTKDRLPLGFPTMRYENGNQYGCVIVPIEADLPMVHLTKRSRRSHLQGVETPMAGADKAFTKLFQAWSEDPVFLQRLLVPDVVELLVGTKGRFTFELYGDTVLCLDHTVQAEEFPPLMSLAVALVERIPADLFAEHPPTPDEVDLDAPDTGAEPTMTPTFGSLPTSERPTPEMPTPEMPAELPSSPPDAAPEPAPAPADGTWF